MRVMPGRRIDDVTGSDVVCAMRHDVSRAPRPHDLLVGRRMDRPPAPSLWEPAGCLTRETGRELMDLLDTRMQSLDLRDELDALAMAMHAASREIAVLLAPALRPADPVQRAA